ncbi:subtilisin-like protein [Trichoderma chlorosporum]
MLRFYHSFTTETKNLQAALVTRDPTELVSGPPRILPDEDNLDRDFVIALKAIICVFFKSMKKREKLLENLSQAHSFFFRLCYPTKSNSVCLIDFSSYPFKHLRRVTKTLFKVLNSNWSCQCECNPLHTDRKTRLSLTQYRRSEMAPSRGQLPSKMAQFQVLFPTHSLNLQWQDMEISVTNQNLENADHKQINNGLCAILDVLPRIRPRLVVFSGSLWQLRPDVDIHSHTQVKDYEFRSLKELLERNQFSGSSSLSSVGKKDRLILSFILATSLLHLLEAPWLQAGLSNESICFLMPNLWSSPDVTKPYLTASFASLSQRSEMENTIQAHPFPDILSLGILLLEIARGELIDFEGAQNRCAATYIGTLECFEKWRDLRIAIQACIKPAEYGKSDIQKAPAKIFHIREYIFGCILFPLKESLSKKYDIELNTLHTYIAKNNKSIEADDFVDENQQNGFSRYQLAVTWSEYLNGVHNLVHNCVKRCDKLFLKDEETTRIRIAVLDTGFQLPESQHDSYMELGRISTNESESLLPGANKTSGNDWQVDVDGHGSRVGQIILEVAPTAVLHVARVFERRKDLENQEIAAEVHKRIAKAIDRATNEWKVDMIVMSFGFDEPILLIQDAMMRALRAEKIPLFFAATHNDGANKRMAWPARDYLAIGISSTTGDGSPSSFNPPEEGYYPVFYSFGEGVPLPLIGLDRIRRSEISYVLGLPCVRMMTKTCPREEQHIYGSLPSRIQTMSGMLPVLRSYMSQKHNCGLKSLLPWDFLNLSLMTENNLLKEVLKAF